MPRIVKRVDNPIRSAIMSSTVMVRSGNPRHAGTVNEIARALDIFLDARVRGALAWIVERTQLARREGGLERTFALNHLAPFLLTSLLLDRLKQSAPARVVTVSSYVQPMGQINFSRLQSAFGSLRQLNRAGTTKGCLRDESELLEQRLHLDSEPFIVSVDG